MTETEIGSDAMLPDGYDPTAEIEADETELAAEQARVDAMTPAEDEPGRQYDDADVTPDGQPPEYDPVPDHPAATGER